MNTDLDVLQNFTSFLHGYVLTMQKELANPNRSYENLKTLVDDTLVITKEIYQYKIRPLEVIRIDKSKVDTLMKERGQSIYNIGALEQEMALYLDVLSKKMDALKSDKSQKETFIDRYGAFYYLYKIFVTLGILITFMKINAGVKQSPYSLSDNRKQERNAAVFNVGNDIAAKIQAQQQMDKIIKERQLVNLQKDYDKLLETRDNYDEQALIKLRNEIAELKAEIQSHKNASMLTSQGLRNAQRNNDELLGYLQEISSCVGKDVCTSETTILRAKIPEIITEIKQLSEFKTAYEELTALMSQTLKISIN